MGNGAAFLQSVRAHREAGRALLATNFYNVETLRAVLLAAEQAGSEIILQTSPSTVAYLGLRTAVAMARAAAEEIGVTAWLHLDHATGLELLRRCVDAGYDSVMIDASEQPFARNVEVTCEAAAYAHAAGVAVEAELGYVPKLGQSAAERFDMTSPDQAREFVEATDIDLLAPAIGNAHGFYKDAPRLDLDRLEQIAAAVGVPLVLHGGSGMSAEQWRACIERGVVKVNFATEIKDAFVRAIRRPLCETAEIDMRKLFPHGIDAVRTLVAEKLAIVGGKSGAMGGNP